MSNKDLKNKIIEYGNSKYLLNLLKDFVEYSEKELQQYKDKLEIAVEALVTIKETEDFLEGNLNADAQTVYNTGYLRGVAIEALSKIKETK